MRSLSMLSIDGLACTRNADVAPLLDNVPIGIYSTSVANLMLMRYAAGILWRKTS